MDAYEFERMELAALERVVGDPSATAMSLTLSLLRQITNNFSAESQIGSGGFATVYKGVLPSGLRIAVKKLQSRQDMDEREFVKEVSIILKATHENIVRLIGYCSHTQGEFIEHDGRLVMADVRERLICMEYVPNGTLERYITDKFHELQWNQRYQILKGICQGLRYLHDEMHIFHGDIKPANISLEDNLVPKIYDFGLSRFTDEREPSGSVKNIRGTMGYIAPEIIDTHCWSIKSDMFSLGVTITEFLTGSRQSWKKPSLEHVLKQLRIRLVKERAFSSWENKYHQVRTCLQIGYDCVDFDPDKRPTALEIIQRLDETESTNYSAPPLWQTGEEESEPSDTAGDTTGETCTQEPDKPERISKLPAWADLSDLIFLEKITDDFSCKRIIGKDGTFKGVHKAFVYKGEIPNGEMIAVKRLIGVEIPVEKFKREAAQFMSLDHKNIVKVVGYCHGQSREHRLVQFKGKSLPQLFNGAEQLLCYEYMHNGSLRDYLIGQGSREIDWEMRYKLIKGTCEGLNYLHNHRGDLQIVHLNLSPSKVLLDKNNMPHIAGFDFSKLIGERNTKSVVLKMNGPIAYLPPDFFHSKGIDLKYLATVDIYSLGLMILEIATQQEIKGNYGVLIRSIEENWREESQIARLYTTLEADKLWQVKMCIDIGLDCVKSNPGKRPTAGDIMLWLDEGRKPIPAPRAGAGVPRPPVRTNVTRADDHIQGARVPGLLARLFGQRPPVGTNVTRADDHIQGLQKDDDKRNLPDDSTALQRSAVREHDVAQASTSGHLLRITEADEEDESESD